MPLDGYIEAAEALIATYRGNGRTDLELIRDILKDRGETDDQLATNRALEMIAYLSMRPAAPTACRQVTAALEASHLEIDAPMYPTDVERVRWADGYTQACDDIRAAIQAAASQ